jgi:uncharacterized membrane protein
MPILSPVGLLHTLLGLAALVLGAAVLLARKGTPAHRRVGRLYALSMVALNATAFLIYRLFGGFGPFHAAALVSLATLAAGWIPIVLRRPRRSWLELHGRFMAWSFVGLLAAFVSEIGVRVPGVPFWPAVVGGTLAVVGGGALMIHTSVPRIAARLAGAGVD